MNVDSAYPLFPYDDPPGGLDRPGSVEDIMLGLDTIALMPTGGDGQDIVGNLQVQGTLLGSGYMLGGSNPDLLAMPLHLTLEGQMLNVFQNRVTFSLVAI